MAPASCRRPNNNRRPPRRRRISNGHYQYACSPLKKVLKQFVGHIMTELFLDHSGQPLGPGDWWTAWNLEPALLIPLALTALVYLWGLRNVWRRAGAGHGIALRHCMSFMGALLALVVALLSPLDALSGVLFSAHMAQHLILMLIAAPLLVLSDFPLALLWALPRPWARALSQRLRSAQTAPRAWGVISSPVSAWLLFALALWVWHAPALFEAALRNEMIHALEHLVFLVSATLFWWVLLKPTRPSYTHYGMAIPYLFTTALHSGILGALMTFGTQPWYR